MAPEMSNKGDDSPGDLINLHAEQASVNILPPRQQNSFYDQIMNQSNISPSISFTSSPVRNP